MDKLIDSHKYLLIEHFVNKFLQNPLINLGTKFEIKLLIKPQIIVKISFSIIIII